MLIKSYSIKFVFFKLAFIVFSVLFLSSCDFFSKRILAKPVVQVENVKFSAKDFSHELANRLKDFDALSAKDPKVVAVQKEQIINDFVISTVVDLWFVENKLSISKEELDAEIKKTTSSYPNDSSFRDVLNEAGTTYLSWIQKVENQIKMKKLFESLKTNSPVPSEQELLSFYNTNRLKYEQKEIVMLSHILVQDQNQAEIIMKLLRKSKFAEIAKEYSSAYANDIGDAFGWVEKGYMVELDKAFRMRVGDVLGPITMADGIHIFKITDKKPYKIKTYAEAKNNVILDVSALREKAQFASWLDVQFKRYSIKKNKAVLDSIKVETQ